MKKKTIVLSILLINSLFLTACVNIKENNKSVSSNKTKIEKKVELPKSPANMDSKVYLTDYKIPKEVNNYVGFYSGTSSDSNAKTELEIKKDGTYTLYTEITNPNSSKKRLYYRKNSELASISKEGSLFTGIIKEEYGKLKFSTISYSGNEENISKYGILDENGNLKNIYSTKTVSTSGVVPEFTDSGLIVWLTQSKTQPPIILTKQDSQLENVKYNTIQIKGYSEAIKDTSADLNKKIENMNDFLQLAVGEVNVEPSVDYAKDNSRTVYSLNEYGIKNLKILDSNMLKDYYTSDNKLIKPTYAIGADKGNLTICYDGKNIYSLDNSSGTKIATKYNNTSQYMEYTVLDD